MSDYMNEYYNQRRGGSPPKKPSIGFFVVALLFVMFGVWMMVTREDVGMDLVAEADLTVVKGKPKVIEVTSRRVRGYRRVKSLDYSVGIVKGYISQQHPKYDEV